MALNWASHFREGRGSAVTATDEPIWPDAPPDSRPAPAPIGTDESGQEDRPASARGHQPSPGDPKSRWLRTISFRGRISLLVAVAVGIAVASTALVSYVAVSRQLERQASANLDGALNLVPELRFVLIGPGQIEVPPDDLVRFDDQTGDVVQVISQSSAESDLPSGERLFKLTPGAERALKEGPGDPVPLFETVSTASGAVYRVVSVPSTIPGVAVQIGYPLASIDSTLAYVRLLLLLVALFGVALATALGWAVGRTSMRPVEELTYAAEHVAETQDLTATIDDSGKDELGRLARSFNSMLEALSASRHQQAQLVSDAGHELRTPLTSLRTNIEVLMRTKALSGPDREELLSDVDAQLRELTTLVGDLVDLARDEELSLPKPELVDFDAIVARAVDRAQRRAMSVHFDVSLQPGQIRAQSALLERAVMNVLDNAAKWSPAGGRVGVDLACGSCWALTVTDQGPGIGPEDLPRIFDRFYRAPSARSMPGSGLGLAIVKRVVGEHGGTIEVTSPPEGGTVVRIELPAEPEIRDC